MRILKVKAKKPEGLIVEFEKKNSALRTNTFSMDCAEAPAPELLACLGSLAQDVVSLCELPGDTSTISVTGVSYSYGGELEIMGATIIARRKLENANSPMNVLTPHKAVEPYVQGGHIDPKAIFDEDTVDRISKLHSLVVDYVNGTREQTSLFEEAPREDD